MESCLRAGEFFFDPKTGVEDIVKLALASVRSLKSGGSQVLSSDDVSSSSDAGSDGGGEDAKEIPQAGETRRSQLSRVNT